MLIRLGLLLIALGLSSGCHAPLVRPIGCEQIQSLQIGQTADEVRKILGEPRAISEGAAVAFYGREPLLTGVQWDYGPPHATSPRLIRDHLDVAFYNDRLTWVSAYRKRTYEEGTEPAFWLMKDPRKPDEPEARRKGPAFDDLFPCGKQ